MLVLDVALFVQQLLNLPMIPQITQNQEYEGHGKHFLEEGKEKETRIFKLM